MRSRLIIIIIIIISKLVSWIQEKHQIILEIRFTYLQIEKNNLPLDASVLVSTNKIFEQQVINSVGGLQPTKDHNDAMHKFWWLNKRS